MTDNSNSNDVKEDCEPGVCTEKDIAMFNADFDASPKNLLAMNVVTHTETNSAALSRASVLTHDHEYSVRIPAEGKPVTAQTSTGRCWLFACLNVMRIPFAAEHKLDSFEFSQSYLYFWDHFERCNFFLEQIIDTLKEPLEGRLVQYLLSKPIEDGGQYDMIVNIVEKYGVVPKQIFPEVEATKSSRTMNRILCFKLREYAYLLRNAFDTDNAITVEKLRELKQAQLTEIWRILVIHFGKPPVGQIRFKCRNKDKNFVCLEAESPLDFYNKFVRQFVNVRDQISLVNDPRNPYFKLYTVDRLCNIIGGARGRVLYVNLPSAVLKQYARTELENGNPVWFGCDVGKHFYRDDGCMDMDNFDYQLLLGTKFNLTKAQRLQYGQSLMTHAMVFTGVDIDPETNAPIKWRVENSWGEKRGHKGYCLMTDAWFDEYNYQLVLSKDKLDAKVVAVLDQEPVVLPPWDPMGSLAKL